MYMVEIKFEQEVIFWTGKIYYKPCNLGPIGFPNLTDRLIAGSFKEQHRQYGKSTLHAISGERKQLNRQQGRE